MKERPILIAIIGYIIGILWGLYLKINIALFYFIIIAIYFIYKKFFYSKKQFKLISIKRYSRYLKLIITPKVIKIFICFSIISNVIIQFQESQYHEIYQQEGEFIGIAIINSNKEEKEYYDRYRVKVIQSDSSQEMEQKYFYIQLKKGTFQDFEYGDKIKIKGEYIKPTEQRNYSGFDYQQYLKTKQIYGTIKITNIYVISNQQEKSFMTAINKISLHIKSSINQVFNERQAGILKGLLLGDTSNIEEEIKDNFSVSNMSHILAVSGMHINYIVMGITEMLNKKIGKRSTKIIAIFILIFYMFITGCSPSVVRATIMQVLLLFSNLVYRKNDIWTSISISLFILLIYNPYLILNIGLQLSYLGTIGILLFNSFISEILEQINLRDRRYIKKVKEILSVSLSAQIAILPVMLYHFNILGIYSILSNLLVSFIIGPIIILGFVFMILSFISLSYAKIVAIFLKGGIQVLLYISNISNLPFSKIYVATPSIRSIFIYMIFLILIKYLYFIYHSKIITTTEKRIRNLISLAKYKFNLNKKKCFRSVVIVLIIISFFRLLPKELKIHFVDVGQGDCAFIVTPKNKTILIDGGGSQSGSFDVGESTLIPYLLDRGYTKINYVFITHFDNDHVGGILTLLEELKVDKIIICKQGEDSQNYQEFLRLIKQKNIKVEVVERGDKVQIENNVYFDILWPDKEQIQENILNNNSIVAKLVYNNFSMLFTGDIEKVAEEEILKKYKNTNILDCNILKVAHHGSKTSSIAEMLDAIRPQIALIGVGENNNFGHPNNGVLQRLNKLRYKNI